MAYTTIDDGSAYFQTTLFTGNDSARDITNGGNSDLQPDLIWVTSRSHGYNNGVFDSSRGTQKELQSNTTSAENTLTAGVSAFNSDGYSYNGANYNTNSYTFVAWQWKANGGTTTTNDASATSVGNVDSVYQANTTAGFSIVTFDLTSDSGDKTIAHGLGQAPDVIIFKNRDDARNWAIHHHTQTPPQYMVFTTDAVASSDNFNNSTDPTSTVFSLETSWHGAHKHVAYCFAEVQGYSKFGSYTGNGNADGPFIYTGFSPSFVMIKCTSQTESWFINDTTRSVDNPTLEALIPNQTAVENTTTGYSIDILSNGFKCRDDAGQQNEGSGNYIYMAFAEQPFVSSDGVPATAR